MERKEGASSLPCMVFSIKKLYGRIYRTHVSRTLAFTIASKILLCFSCFRPSLLLHGGVGRQPLPKCRQLLGGLALLVVVIAAQNPNLSVRFMRGVEVPPPVHSRKLRDGELVQILRGPLRGEVASGERWRRVLAGKYRISRPLGVVIPTGRHVEHFSQYAEPNVTPILADFAVRGVQIY